MGITENIIGKDYLTDDNVSPEVWWRIAQEYPLEARRSHLFDVMTLERPGGWAELEHRADLARYIITYQQQLTHYSDLMLRAEYLDKVIELNFGSKAFLGTDVRMGPWQYIEELRNHANGLSEERRRDLTCDVPISQSNVFHSKWHVVTHRSIHHAVTGLFRGGCGGIRPYGVLDIMVRHLTTGLTLDMRLLYLWGWQRILHYLLQQDTKESR